MGFSMKSAQAAVNKYVDSHSGADFENLGVTLGAILRTITP